ncbi:hypothetical protein TWF569_001945 [Orbilia oligospora]|uniref:Zn(2)-C6 fungal-type domain-containing protein n=2 Tax=Orbilia oligospora TaxID=2813651 RepID=A0A7C8J9U6_ORBOL|nr:hypothetical protein TWF706_006346 [Orbilia oligospora]KAF3104944.1 hypothetical protein TWF102_002707 [Orbilia oligospora]KAF3116134.1 hypothetical protein TWF103_009364 [Orbilia oligospora]KAF3146240.1 hypothetical protein TWF594_003560 [Orbilia oligospora]KAF3153636.1 hypothetical protein TWF569_001945 [Orbilia oligospora]
MSGRPSGSKAPLRKLRPAPALQPRPAMVAKSNKKTRAKTACMPCQQSKRKCDEESPKCSSCIESDLDCIYSVEGTARHKRNIIRDKIKDYESDIAKYERILDHIKGSSVSSLQRVLEVIRGQATLEEIMMFIRNDQAAYLPTELISPVPTTSSLSLLMNEEWYQGIEPLDRINLEILDDRPILDVTAHPWTTVTDDDELVSHLMSLYMTWDHPVWHLFDWDIFIDAMKTGDTTYCSPLLVNATLAEACHYSNRISFRADPHNPNFIGHRFFQEAMRLWNEETTQIPTLLTVQSALMIGVTLAADGMDRLGGMFLNNGIRLCRELFLQPSTEGSMKGKDVAAPQTDAEKKFEFARQVTVWAAFSFQSMYDWVARCAHTMPPPDLPLPYLESHCPVGYPVPDGGIPIHPVQHKDGGAFREVKAADEWRPYPYIREPELNVTRVAFQCHATLHVIAYELAEKQLESINGEKSLSLLEKKRFYRLLDEWKEKLPEEIQDLRNISPGPTFMNALFHILVLDIHQNKIKDEEQEDPTELELFKDESEARFERSKSGLYVLMDIYNRKNGMFTMSQPLTFPMLIVSQNAMASLAKVKGLETPTPVPEGGEKEDTIVRPILARGPYDEDHAVQTFENTLQWACNASTSFVTIKIFVRLMQLEAKRIGIQLSPTNIENLRRVFQWENKDKGKWIEELEKTQTSLMWRKKKKESNIVDMVKSLEELTVAEG